MQIVTGPRVLILQHTDLTTPGSAPGILAAAGIPFQVLHLHRGHALPPDDTYDALLICGGGVHVDQADRAPYLRTEKTFIERAIGRGIPTLGLCLGGQLLAQILGAAVYPHPRGWEVGWRDVTCLATPDRPGFERAAVRTVSHYHRYVFDLPAGARLLARNAWWPCQGFTYGEHVVALQFHPERTLTSNRELALEADLPEPGPAVQTRAQILELARHAEPPARAWFAQVLLGTLAPGETFVDLN